jgi:hypothetical protein
MPTVSAMHEQMHERARQDDQVGDPAQQMRPMFGNQVCESHRACQPDHPAKQFVATGREFPVHVALPLFATWRGIILLFARHRLYPVPSRPGT